MEAAGRASPARNLAALALVLLVLHFAGQPSRRGLGGPADAKRAQARRLQGGEAVAPVALRRAAAEDQAAFCSGLSSLDYPAPVVEIAWKANQKAEELSIAAGSDTAAAAAAAVAATAPSTPAASTPHAVSATDGATAVADSAVAAVAGADVTVKPADIGTHEGVSTAAAVVATGKPVGNAAVRPAGASTAEAAAAPATLQAAAAAVADAAPASRRLLRRLAAADAGSSDVEKQRQAAWEHLVKGRHEARAADLAAHSSQRGSGSYGSGWSSNAFSDDDAAWDYDAAYGSLGTDPYWETYQQEQARKRERAATRARIMLKEGIQAKASFGSSQAYSMYYFAENDIVSSFIHSQASWETGESSLMAEKMQEVATAGGLTPEQVFFLDVGANIGAHSLVMAAFGFSVIAFEPLRVNEMTLRHTLCANAQLAQRFSLVPRGLGNRTMTCMIYSIESNQGDGTVNCNPQDKMLPGFIKRQDLQIERLDDVLAEWMPQLADRVGVMKIDVEGNELSVVQGATQFFRTVRPRYVMAECADGMMELATGKKAGHFFQAMHELGYSVHRGRFGGELVPQSSFSSFVEDGIVNYWLVHKSVKAGRR